MGSIKVGKKVTSSIKSRGEGRQKIIEEIGWSCSASRTRSGARERERKRTQFRGRNKRVACKKPPHEMPLPRFIVLIQWVVTLS